MDDRWDEPASGRNFDDEWDLAEKSLRNDRRFNLYGKAASALRSAGYMRAHRWWLTPEQWEQVRLMAQENLPEVTRIKERAVGR